MSKCDFAIQFEQPERTFRPGEPIRGTATIEVNRDFSCDRVVIEHYWKTHGKGNRQEGPKEIVEFPAAEFRAGQRQQFPFEFTAPPGPPTYHGTYLNIDHYVRIYADIPWAIDPKHEEDYMLQPGDQSWGWLPAVSAKSTAANQGGGWFALAILVAFMIFFGSIMLPCAIIPGFIAVIVFYKLMQKSLARQKLGVVGVEWGNRRVAPGGEVPLRLRITPPKAIEISGVTARVLGREICTSGSGTNRSTHTHTLYDQRIPVAASMQLPGRRLTELTGSISVPPTAGYSFSTTDNELKWSVELRVDVPRWPDWVEETVLEVRPDGEPAAARVEYPEVIPVLAPPLPADTVFDRDSDSLDSSPSPFLDRDTATGPEASEAPAGAAGEPSSTASLEAFASELAEAPRYGSERTNLVSRLLGHTVEAVLNVESVNRTFDYVSDAFRNGRTVIGRLAGTDLQLAVQFPATENERLDTLGPDAQLPIRAVPLKWNIIYDRLELQAVV